MEYIKWLSLNDLALGSQLKRMDEIFKVAIERKDYTNINEIMELFIVCKYMTAQIYPSVWSQKDISEYKKIVKKFKGILGKYFNTFPKNKIKNIYYELTYKYRKMFWEVFSEYKLFDKIEYSFIKEIMEDHKYAIRDILLKKSIVDAYDEELREELLSLKETAEWLLDEYEVYHECKKEKLYFPKKLDVDDKKQIIRNYVEWEDANLNYLQIIMNIQDNPDALVIGDRIRLQTKKRVEQEQEKLFSGNGGFETEIKVVFGKMSGDDLELDMNPKKIVCKYNSSWIEENLDEPTLLNNFIYWFEYVDKQWRIILVEKDVHKGIVEKSLFMHSKHGYEPGYATRMFNTLADMQMAGYYQQLKKNGKQLEDIFKWFFEKYLLDEFAIRGFRMNVPSLNTSYLEKCRTMLSEMDGVLKQYNLYIEDGYVNQELFQISSSHMKFCDCKSVLKEKYVYGMGDEFRIAKHYLFSNQSHVTYVKRIKKSYDSFYSLIRNETIYDTDFNEYAKPILKLLVKYGYILINNHEIKFSNLLRVNLLKQLNDNDVISYWHLSKELKEEIQKMQVDRLVCFKSSLFSQKEYEYFDYYLNKATFNNGMDLRNMYLHGSQPNGSEDEKIHMSNYWIILKLFVLCILKICDDIETSAYIKEYNLNVD